MCAASGCALRIVACQARGKAEADAELQIVERLLRVGRHGELLREASLSEPALARIQPIPLVLGEDLVTHVQLKARASTDLNVEPGPHAARHRRGAAC